MKKHERISPLIRAVSGVIGILRFAAIAFTAMQDDGFKPDIILFASFFAGFIFLFVAVFGSYPWDRSDRDE